jgi:cation diffusion facilitator CzcD-associated flavoprotein CzcO
LSSRLVDIAVVGAGPYGLSIAAHLAKSKLSYRVFGTPMSSWRNHMPSRTLLKSDGFASSLYDPESSFTLEHYCKEQSLPYADVGLPVPIETFIAYGLEFQKRFVPQIEETDVTEIEEVPEGYRLTTREGNVVRSKRVVVAAGITHFANMPPMLAGLPAELLTHSSEHKEVSGFAGRKVGVIGAGASAVDLAGLLHEAGADVHLIARRQAIAFHEPSAGPRPLSQRLLMPRSGLGLGWRSRLCTDAPLLFHSMPSRIRKRAVERHLGPAPGWFAKTRFVGRVTSHLGTKMQDAGVRGDRIYLKFTQHDGKDTQIDFDHVVAATGYKVRLERLAFLSPGLRKVLATEDDVPRLTRNFESAAPGLYFVGLASSNSFGPLCRFAYGAKFTSKRLVRHLAVSA